MKPNKTEGKIRLYEIIREDDRKYLKKATIQNEPYFIREKERKFWTREIFKKTLKITMLKLKLKIIKLFTNRRN